LEHRERSILLLSPIFYLKGSTKNLKKGGLRKKRITSVSLVRCGSRELKNTEPLRAAQEKGLEPYRGTVEVPGFKYERSFIQ